MSKLRPAYFVRLDIQRLGLEITDRAKDRDLAAWVRSFHRALALGQPELNSFAAELMAEVEGYREHNRQAALKRWGKQDENASASNRMQSHAPASTPMPEPAHTDRQTDRHSDKQEERENTARARNVLANVDPGNLMPAKPDPDNIPATREAIRPATAPGATQGDLDRALAVLRLYPAAARKDGRPVARPLHAQNLLASRIARAPDYPWEEHAFLVERLELTPKNADGWVQDMPNPAELESLRKTGRQRGIRYETPEEREARAPARPDANMRPQDEEAGRDAWSRMPEEEKERQRRIAGEHAPEWMRA